MATDVTAIASTVSNVYENTDRIRQDLGLLSLKVSYNTMECGLNPLIHCLKHYETFNGRHKPVYELNRNFPYSDFRLLSIWFCLTKEFVVSDLRQLWSSSQESTSNSFMLSP